MALFESSEVCELRTTLINATQEYGFGLLGKSTAPNSDQMLVRANELASSLRNNKGKSGRLESIATDVMADDGIAFLVRQERSIKPKLEAFVRGVLRGG